MESADEGSNSSLVVNEESDNESIKSHGSGSSNVSRVSGVSRTSRSSYRSRRSCKSSGSSHNSPSGDEAEERRSVMDSDEENDREKKKVSKEVFGASNDDVRKLGSRTGSHSRNNSGSRAGSTRSKSCSISRSQSKLESRAASGSQSRSCSKSQSRAESRSRSRSRSRSKSGSRSVSDSRSRSHSKSSSRSLSRSKLGIRKSGKRSPSRNKSGNRKSGSRSCSHSKSGSRSRSGSESRCLSKSPSKSVSRSRSCSKSSSRSYFHGKSESRSRSHSRSGSLSRSHSKSGSRSRSREKSGSRSDSWSRSRSRSRSRSSSIPRSCSGSRSESASDVPRKNSRVVSDSDSSRSDIGRKKKVIHKRKATGSGSGSGTASDSDLGEPESKKKIKKKRKSIISGSESESASEKDKGSGSDNDDKVRNASLIKSGSDDEGSKPNTDSQKAHPQLSDSEDEALRQQIRDNPDQQDEFVNDFDTMLAKKKSERGFKRKKAGVDIINDNEENISLFVRRMRDAAEEDRQLNMRRKPATKKMSMLQITMQQISKVELIEGFLEANVLSALTDWMAPMPDRQLPTPRLRECILRWLLNLPPLAQDMLKQSGIGKAVMYLYKHPKELKINKERCGRLINMWSRPIFNNSDDLTSLTKEERLDRDMQLMASGNISRSREKDTPSNLDENGKPLRPGDKGWCYRARVPMPSMKEFVKRPKWNSDTDMSKVQKGAHNRLDKQILLFQQRKRESKYHRAVPLSVEGRNMTM